MSEVLLCEKKMKNGEWKMYVDKENKFVRGVGIGAWDQEAIDEYFAFQKKEIMKFNKGESYAMHDGSLMDQRFVSPGILKSCKDSADFTCQYCKKTAAVLSSFVLAKAISILTANNYRVFNVMNDAKKWLFS